MITIVACAECACTGDWYHGYQDIEIQYTTLSRSLGNDDSMAIGGSMTDKTKSMG